MFEGSSQEIKMLALKLSGVTDRVETRLAQVSEQTLTASRTLTHNAQQAQKIADDTLQGALSEFRHAASDTVADGMRDAVANYEHTLAASVQKLATETGKLERQMHAASAAHLATAWKAFIAFALAAISLIAVAGYMIWQARDAVREVQWVQEINTAVTSGKLTRCPEDGLCAMVNKRWQRIDH
jgi:hypothetical protein